MKRVKILLRASTSKQVEKRSNDEVDIPAQRRACREFVDRMPDWKIIDEVVETISGFKVSAKKRDAILTLQNEALEGKFDILLVFKFDRIGRKENETPFLVEFFVENGIEVWSTVEGQRKLEQHTDKLLNYITFWHAEGESRDTSIRTKNGMRDMVLEGRWKGGVPAFGYKAVNLGRINKRGREVLDLVIDEEEARVVRMIYDRYINAGLGTHSIGTYLMDRGILNRTGENFVSPTIRSILRNPLYRGILRSGDAFSEPFEHLRIIDEETFERASQLMDQRKRGNQEHRTMPLMTKGSVLLSGNIFCGHCGARLTATTCGKMYARKDGSQVNNRYWRYNCYNKTRHRHKCDGQTGYKAQNIDNAIITLVKELFEELKQEPLSDYVDDQYAGKADEGRIRTNNAQAQVKKLSDDLAALKEEIVKSIQGKSNFTPDLLNESISRVSAELEQAEMAAQNLAVESDDKSKIISSIKKDYDKMMYWSEIFDECETAVKKMIVANLIDRVIVSKDNIEVKFKINIEQYRKFTEERKAG